MGERDVNFEGYTHEDDDPYENEKRVASFFMVAKEQATRLVTRRFDTLDAASDASAKFVATFSEIAAGTEGLAYTDVYLRGSNIKVSNITTEQTKDGRYIVGIDPDEPHVTAPPYAEPSGRCDALVVSLGQDEAGFFTVPMARFVDAESDEASLVVNQVSVADVHITKYIFAPLHETEFVIPVLEDAERRRKALSDVVLRYSGQPTKVTDAFRAISAAIATSNKRTFTAFEHVESFRALSDLPDGESIEQVLDTFRDVMGPGRQVQMKADAYVGGHAQHTVNNEYTGTFVDIVPVQESLGVNEPMMVISPIYRDGGDEEEQLVYVPLSKIEEFRF